jgi:hypothetical protein
MKNNIDKSNKYFDLGATHHVTSNKRKISRLIEIDSKAEM